MDASENPNGKNLKTKKEIGVHKQETETKREFLTRKNDKNARTGKTPTKGEGKNKGVGIGRKRKRERNSEQGGERGGEKRLIEQLRIYCHVLGGNRVLN
jgi:hypothetical protein